MGDVITRGLKSVIARKNVGRAVSDQSAPFGALTPSTEGGFKPYNGNNETVDLVAVVDQTGATRTWSIDGSGALVSNGTPAVDDGLTITCSYLGGIVILTIDSIASSYSVANLTELTTFFNLSAANKSGKNCYVRGGNYATTNLLVNGKFESLTDWCKFIGHNSLDKPVWGTFAIVNTTVTGLTQGYVELDALAFDYTSGTESKLTGLLNSNHNFIEVANGNPASKFYCKNLDFTSDAPIARTTGLRPAERVNCIVVKRGDDILVQDCTAQYVTTFNEFTCTNATAERNTCRYLWDDPYRVVADGTTSPTGIVIRNNTSYDFIGDNGYHPDGVHMFSSGGSLIDGIDIYGNLVFPGNEGMLTPAWPVSVDGGAYTRDASLTTSGISLDDTDDERFIFIDSSSSAITVTLTDPALAAGDVDMLLQAWLTPANTIDIDPDGHTLYDFDNAANITSWDIIEPWETIQMRLDKAGDRWTLHRKAPSYQGFFSNTPTNGVDNVNIYNNIVWFNQNSVTQDGANSSGWEVWNNSYIPSWPGSINGSSRSNTKPQYGPSGLTRFIAFDGSTSHASGNIASTVTGEVVLNGDTVDNVLEGELNLNETWADMVSSLTVNSAIVEQHYPTTPAEAISMARPKAGGTLDSLGMGAGLDSDSANDYYNFGQDTVSSVGFLSTTPWFVRRLVVTASGGGFTAVWRSPHLINGAITSYDLEYSVNGGGFSALAGVGTNETATYSSASVSDTIIVRVRANNSNGASGWITADSITVVLPSSVVATVALKDHYVAAGGGSGASSNEYEGGAFTPAGTKPLLILVHLRSSSDVDQPVVSATIGTAARSFGTGTALTEQVRLRQSRANVYAYWIASPSASSQTIQMEFTAAGNGCQIETLEVTDGTAVGATASNGGASRTTTTPSITTTATNSLVVYAVTNNNNATISDTDTTQYENTINGATRASAVKEDAATIATYSTDFTWTGSTESVAVAVEIQ